MGLMECLDRVADPRCKRGVRHPAPALIKALLLGFLSGHNNVEQIAEFIQKQGEAVCETLGFKKWYAPDASTYRLFLSKMPPEALQEPFQEWLSEMLAGKVVDVSVDGKACRGCPTGEKPQEVFRMLNVFVHDIQVTIAQWQIGNKAGEPTVLADHLAELFERYPGIRLLVGDAYFSGRNLCQLITETHQRHYLVRIKGNQGDVQEALQTWFDEEVTRKKARPQVQEKPEKKGA